MNESFIVFSTTTIMNDNGLIDIGMRMKNGKHSTHYIFVLLMISIVERVLQL
jgi:hypothetical protein